MSLVILALLVDTRSLASCILRVVYTSTKRDQGCLWFTHLPEVVVSQMRDLPPDAPIILAINGSDTVWRRMKPGGGKPTMGVRITAGRTIWDKIPLGEEFSIVLVPHTS